MEFNFDEKTNVAVFTTSQIMRENRPILYVCHDEEDGAWQFLTGDDVSIADVMIVALEEIVEHDNTVNQLFDLPMGYRATRKSINDKWQWEKMEEDK